MVKLIHLYALLDLGTNPKKRLLWTITTLRHTARRDSSALTKKELPTSSKALLSSEQGLTKGYALLLALKYQFQCRIYMNETGQNQSYYHVPQPPHIIEPITSSEPYLIFPRSGQPPTPFFLPSKTQKAKRKSTRLGTTVSSISSRRLFYLVPKRRFCLSKVRCTVICTDGNSITYNTPLLLRGFV